jgi:hypothetical protein
MSEKPEENYDLELNMTNLPDCITALEKIVRHSLTDCNTEIVYGNGKTVKIKDLFNTFSLAQDVYDRLHILHSSELTCSLKKPTTS